MIIWLYVFEDGERYELLNKGLSILDIEKLQEVHGKCIERGRRKGASNVGTR